MIRLLITALILVAKVLDDEYFSNKYTNVGGYPSVAEMNFLEIEMLKLLEYNLYLPQNQVRKYFVDNLPAEIHS